MCNSRNENEVDFGLSIGRSDRFLTKNTIGSYHSSERPVTRKTDDLLQKGAKIFDDIKIMCVICMMESQDVLKKNSKDDGNDASRFKMISDEKENKLSIFGSQSLDAGYNPSNDTNNLNQGLNETFIDENEIEPNFDKKEQKSNTLTYQNMVNSLTKINDKSVNNIKTFAQSIKFHITPCGHTFHENCLKNWEKYHQTCPICRSRINYKHDEV